MTPEQIRQADPDEAAAIAALIRQSITELCVADHQNDSNKLNDWLGNKTAENVVQWIQHETNTFLVAEMEQQLASIALMGHRPINPAEILLCYTHPQYLRRGAASALISALEQRAYKNNAVAMVVDSSITAKTFYAACGFHPVSHNAETTILQKRLR